MKKSYGNRLFRLFLLFSIIPALILTAAGYYMSLETGSLEEGTNRNLNTEIAGYYNDLLYADLEESLREYRRAGTEAGLSVDFLFTEFENDFQEVIRHESLTPPVMRAIMEAGTERPRGIVTQRGLYFQYSAGDGGDGKRFYAGIVHEAGYGDLVGSIESDLAKQSSSRILKSEYAFFLALLFVGLSALTIVLAYLFSSRMSRNLSRPLSDLSAAAKRIADGDFDQRVKPTGDREIRALIASFNSMAGQLDQTAARLAQTERVAAWRQVARRFAHELKNPIQPILVSLYRIEKQLINTEAYDKIYEPLKAASDELKHLTALADRFSSLAKLPEPSFEKTDLKALVESVINLYETELKAFGFSYSLPEGKVVTMIDPAYLREALHNIIQNAMDASVHGSRIILTLKHSGDRVDISLQDFGDGMDPETAAAARLPYFTTKEKGSGLGLAIVEKSVGEMGGQLQVDSERGHGTTVTISLPRRELVNGVTDTDS